jgi:hypothetical protein
VECTGQVLSFGCMWILRLLNHCMLSQLKLRG